MFTEKVLEAVYNSKMYGVLKEWAKAIPGYESMTEEELKEINSMIVVTVIKEDPDVMKVAGKEIYNQLNEEE